MQRRERFSRVVNAVQALPDKQREVIVRHALDGDSHETIASDMGMTAGAIRQLAHRARATVRAAAASLFPAPLARFLPWGAESVPAAKVAAAVVVAGAAGGGAIEVARHDPLPRRAEAVAKAPEQAARPCPSGAPPSPCPTAVATATAVPTATRREAAAPVRERQRERGSSSGPGSGDDSSGPGSGGDESSGLGLGVVRALSTPRVPGPAAATRTSRLVRPRVGR